MPAVHFQTGRSAREAHLSLQSSLKTMDQARHCAVLWFAEIQNRKLYRDLGYSSMRHYALAALGFSSSRCGDFMRLAAKLNELPVVRASLESGALGYTKAAEVIKVATPRTETRWVKTARITGRRELAVQVKAARRGTNPDQGNLLPDVPHEVVEISQAVTIEMSPLQYARFESLSDGTSDLAEALLAGLSKSCPQAVARRRAISMIHVHECPECGKATVTTGRGERSLSRQSHDRIACDAVIAEPGKPNRAVVPPKLREAVMQCARHRCETPGCGHIRFLEVHHIQPRAAGGANRIDNLKVLCSACHRLHHEMAPSRPAERRRTPNCPI
jgi:5-methylcytosine-specific restriction endonuclease McrA